jgi:transcriptional regulator
MYIPKYTAMPDRAQQLAFMRANSFATVVTSHNGDMIATHVPVRTIVAEDAPDGAAVTLCFHLAKPNSQVGQLRAGAEALVIFNGPHAYISPSNYEKPDVPTWNYVAVHAYGVPREVTGRDAQLALLADLIGHYESAFQAQWDEMPEAYRNGMLAGIVGFELQVARIEGKAKLSQNHSAHDQQAVADWLLAHAHATPRAVGALMRKRLQGDGV